MPPTFSSPFQPNQPDQPKPNDGSAAMPPSFRPFTQSAEATSRSSVIKSSQNQPFIPKASLAKPLKAPQTDGPMGGLLITLSLVIFALALASWAAAWSYQKLVYQEINKSCSGTSRTSLEGCGLRESVIRQKERLGGEALNRIKRLEAKLATANILLTSHNTLVPLFDKLNSITLKTIQYKKFEYKEDGTVTIEGLARSYEDVAVQSKVFGRERTIKSFLFSDLNAAPGGLVSFKLVMSVGPELTSFVADVASPVQGAQDPEQLATSSVSAL